MRELTRIGILSDTHGQVRRTAAAGELFRQLGVQAFVHCGDVGGPAVLDQLAGLRGWLVRGNMDDEDPTLDDYARALGMTVARTVPLRLELGGCVLLAFHGHEAQLGLLLDGSDATAALRAAYQNVKYILYGHRHVPADSRYGSWRLINPGALYRVAVPTVATLDLATDDVRFWHVPDVPAPHAAPTPVQLT